MLGEDVRLTGDSMKYHIKDDKTHEIVKTVNIDDEDEFIEVGEIAEALGFYLEEAENG